MPVHFSLLCLLLACAPEAPSPLAPEAGVNPGAAEDSAPFPEEALVVDEGFELGPVESCDSPAELAWVDAAPRGSAPFEHGDHFGAIALVDQEGELVVLHSEGQELVAWELWSGAERGRWEMESTIYDMVVGDFDGDGRNDALVAADELYILPDLITGGRSYRLTSPEDERTIHAMLPIDLDLDGQKEILVGYIHESWEPELLQPELLDLQGFEEAVVRPVQGEASSWGMVFHLGAVDLDEDGLLDAYVCNDVGALVNPNQLLQNDGQGGLSAQSGTGLEAALSCMGHSFADLDADGDLDLYVAALEKHGLWLRDPALGAYDASASMGLPAFAAHQMAWGSAPVDLNNDGRVDLAVSTGDFEREGQSLFPLHLLEQQGDGTFEEVGEARGMPQETGSRGIIVSELNGDGVPDLLVADTERPPHLLLSQGCQAGHWLEVEAPEGSVVRLRAGGREQVAMVSARPGYRATGPLTVHFGLGDEVEIEGLQLHLPGGDVAHIEGHLEDNRRIRWQP
jgi:hypothetical protein